MKCPKCGDEVRPSKKYPGYYLCDTCKKRYAASSVIEDDDALDDDSYDDDYGYDDGESQPSGHSDSYDYYDTPKSIKSGPSAKARTSSGTSNRKKKNRGRKNKKKKGGVLKFILLVLLALIVLGFVANALGLIDLKKDSKKKDDKKTTQVTDNDGGEADTGTKDTYTVGETAEHKGVQIQLIGYEESPGNDWGAPAEGNTFVFVNLEVTNNSDGEISVSSMASFENYCGDYKLDYSSNAFTALATDSEKQQMDGSIASGKKLNGYLCLEVPADWTSIEIHYSESIWSDSNIKFVINK